MRARRPFGIPDRLDGHASQAERISTWRQPNEIQTGSGGGERIGYVFTPNVLLGSEKGLAPRSFPTRQREFRLPVSASNESVDL